jgi:hypothetical protein
MYYNPEFVFLLYGRPTSPQVYAETVDFQWSIFLLTCSSLWFHWATGWTAEESGVYSQQGKIFSFPHNVQIGSGAHAVSCTVGTGGRFFSPPYVFVPWCLSAGITLWLSVAEFLPFAGFVVFFVYRVPQLDVFVAVHIETVDRNY